MGRLSGEYDAVEQTECDLYGLGALVLQVAQRLRDRVPAHNDLYTRELIRQLKDGPRDTLLGEMAAPKRTLGSVKARLALEQGVEALFHLGVIAFYRANVSRSSPAYLRKGTGPICLRTTFPPSST